MRLFKCTKSLFTGHEVTFVGRIPVSQDLQAPFSVRIPERDNVPSGTTGTQSVAGPGMQPLRSTCAGPNPALDGAGVWLGDDFPETGKSYRLLHWLDGSGGINELFR